MIAFLPDQTRISQVRLRTAKLEDALAFYSGALGLRAQPGPGPQATLSAPGGAALVILSEDNTTAARPPRSRGLHHFALRYPDRMDLARACRRLVDRGCAVAEASDHGVSEAIYFKDRDGNGVELSTDRPRSDWPTENGGIAMRSGPLNLGSLLATAAGESGTDDPPAQLSIGHIHFHVADLAAAERFYSQFLGLAVAHRSSYGATFFAAGAYHHHIGVDVQADKTAPPAECAGLVSYRVEVPVAEILYCLAHRAPILGYEVRAAPMEPGAPVLQIRDPNGLWLEVQAAPAATVEVVGCPESTRLA